MCRLGELELEFVFDLAAYNPQMNSGREKYIYMYMYIFIERLI